MKWYQRAAQWLRSRESEVRKSVTQHSPEQAREDDCAPAIEAQDEFSYFYDITPKPDPLQERRKHAEELLRRLHAGSSSE